jgi:hypothetical protein
MQFVGIMVMCPAGNTPAPMMHLQTLLKSFRRLFSARSAELRRRAQAAGTGREGNACFLGKSAVVVLAMLSSAFAKELGTQDLPDDAEAAEECMQDGCALLALPLSCTGSLASTVASYPPSRAASLQASFPVGSQQEADAQLSPRKRSCTEAAAAGGVPDEAAGFRAGSGHAGSEPSAATAVGAAAAAAAEQTAQPSSPLQPSQRWCDLRRQRPNRKPAGAIPGGRQPAE